MTPTPRPVLGPAFEFVEVVDEQDGLRIIRLNRAGKRNAINTQMSHELLQAFDDVDADESIGAVLLAGAGPVFCAGGDVREFSGAEESVASVQARTELNARLLARPTLVRVPIVCAVHGAAVGGGAALALASDLVVMGASATIAYPEARHGMVGALVMASLVQHVGVKRSFELLSFGEHLNSEAALQWGLANRVVEDENLLQAATAIAQRLAALPRAAIAMTKSLLRESAHQAIDDVLANGVSRLRSMRGL